MNFLLDENIPPSLTKSLSQLRHTAIHVRDVNLAGETDQIIFDYALSNALILITHDLDYSRIHALSGKSKPSVILFRMEVLTLSKINVLLSDHLQELETDLIKGAFIVIEEGQIRVRELPIKRS